MKIVLEPVFEADFLPCSFGFRPKRSAHDALQVLIDECWRGRRWVVETDIASCFSAIPHEKLMEAVEERICDQPVLKLLRAMLRAGVMEDGQVRRETTRAPRGWSGQLRVCSRSVSRASFADSRPSWRCSAGTRLSHRAAAPLSASPGSKSGALRFAT